MKLCTALSERRFFGHNIKRSVEESDASKWSKWHHFSLSRCSSDISEIRRDVFLGFTGNGNFMLSYSMVPCNPEFVFYRYKFYLKWWLIKRENGCEGGLKLDLVKKTLLFNGKDFRSTTFIRIYHWPDDQSKVLIHGIGIDDDYAQHDGAATYSICSVTVAPNPPLTTGGHSYLEHDWSISFNISTQCVSFHLELPCSGICNLKDAVIFNNGYSLTVIQLKFHFESDPTVEITNHSTDRKEVSVNCSKIDSPTLIEMEKQISCMTLKTDYFFSNKKRISRNDAINVSERLSFAPNLDEKGQLAPRVNMLSLGIIVNDHCGLAAPNQWANIDSDDAQFISAVSTRYCIEVSQLSLDVEELIGFFLDSRTDWLDLDLTIQDYNPYTLHVCPSSNNIFFHLSLVLSGMPYLTHYKCSLVVRWNPISRDFGFFNVTGLVKTADTKIDYKEFKKAVGCAKRNFRSLTKDTMELNNTPFLRGKSRPDLVCKEQHLVLTL